MRVAFIVDALHHREIFSIPILSAILKQAGHDVSLIEFIKVNHIQHMFTDGTPEIIAYSLMSCELETYRKINTILKQHYDFFSVFGGPHPTFSSDFCSEPFVDAICKGEGDDAFPEFLSHFPKESMYSVSNFHFKKENGRTVIENPLRNLVCNLDALPFPDRKIIFDKNPFLAKMPIKSFMTSRGCPFHCTYCFNHAYNKMYHKKGKIVRIKSVDYLIEEIQQIRKAYPMQFIKFHDDIFGLNKDWLETFVKKYRKEIGLPFGAYSRANLISKDYVKLMKSAGCVTIVMAIESGDEHIRNTVLKRNMSDNQIIKAAQLINAEGIHLYTLNMIGLPGETEKEMYKTIQINQKIKPELAESNLFKLYEGLEITDYSLKYGYAYSDFNKRMNLDDLSNLSLSEQEKKKLSVLNELFVFISCYPRLAFLLKLTNILYPFRGLIKIIRSFFTSYKIIYKIYPTPIPFSVIVDGVIHLLKRKNNQL
ncbi:MAG: radical SAM protein [Desulfobacterales bacterium]|nr:radical SAM protein [Desulfobacterales bacterium]